MPFTTADDNEKNELATTYAALVLNDAEVDITEENINKVLKAANVQVEPYWPKLFATLLKDRDVGELLLTAGGAPGAGGAAPAGGAAGGAEEQKEEAAPEPEAEEESEEEMGFSLFD
eukprot:CAMPEP_0183350634 /NCGR_PEP_ID=MMETSP0164_2-20130417/20695_1 /TAXON_ID=221442 /ORGANISM="Coccolithus pelagicus ssp braarudi, Strain PLY182g" /LENGTH=116 /DNA_ID=CAMNT_0025522605 /DNA_START=55 /DNA_END=405 /DNA_ORIENTATION=-